MDVGLFAKKKICNKGRQFLTFYIFSISFTQIQLAKIGNPKTYLEKAFFIF